MKKQLFFIIIGLFILTSCQNTTIEPKKITPNKIKTIKTCSLSREKITSGNCWENPNAYISKDFYNSNGKRTKRYSTVFYTVGDKTSSKVEVSIYDENENVINRNGVDYEPSKPPKVIEKINDKGKQITKIGSAFTDVVQYNHDNQIVEITTYGKAGMLVMHENEFIKNRHKISKEWDFVYDKNGNNIHSKAWQELRDNHQMHTEFFSKYNKYNDRIYIKRITQINDKKSKIRIDNYKYKYNLKGDWIEKIHYIDGKKINYEVRQISYY